jgi:hypothetical protein
MPLPVTAWTGDTFPTAKSLTLACYTIDGTLDKPNGILFHGQRYITLEVLGDRSTTTTSYPSSPTGGTRSEVGNSGAPFPAVMLVDGAGYYGQTSDGTFWISGYTFTSAVIGSNGDGVTPGGWTILCHFIPVIVNSTTSAVGADMEDSGALLSSGTRQRPPGTSSLHCCPFYLELQEVTGAKLEPAVLVADTASTAVKPEVNTTDSSGETPRFFTIWEGVSNANQGNYGTPALPTPYSGYTGSTTIGTTGSATVNLNSSSGIAGPLNFLSNAPMFRGFLASSQSIPSGTATQVTLGTGASVDNYSGWTASTYTVQRAGLYLVHCLVPYTASISGQRRAGISVNSTNYWGPGYQACQAGPTFATKTQIFSLQAGDTVAMMAQQDTGSSLALANTDFSRMFLAWLGEEGVPSTLWTPPDTSFRWTAGTPGIQLPGLFQQHVANDLGFLVNRPYLMAYQTQAQSGFANNSWNTIVLDTVEGIIHSDTGDNYSGWTSGSSNLYTSQAAGWYLAVAEYFGTYATTASTAGTAAGFAVSSSGGRTPGSSPDWYQEMFPSSATYPPGATAVGLYFLDVGETIQPQLRGDDYASSTWGTQTATGINSHMELVWLSN